MITSTVILAFIIGVLTVPVIWAARFWAKDLGLRITWWKWLLAGFWYLLLLFFVFMDFTFIGEGETGAGLKLLAAEAVIMIILGAGVARLILTDHEREKS